METEIEVKFLNINPEEFRKKLTALKAKKIHPEILMKRKAFDYPDKKLEKIGAWIRVRNEGNKITFSYKRLLNRTLHGTKEISVEVNDFEKTCEILKAIGLKQTSYQETKRELWILNNCEVTIDTWPWIPTFVEIEGPSEDKIKETCRLLELKLSKGLHGSVETAYQKYFSVTEAEIDSWETITFTPTPSWLEIKRK